MIEIPVHNQAGQQVDTLQVDEQLLGGEVRPLLLKQAYVRYHANRRQGSAKTKTRSELSRSTRKLYRQKGTGNARRGDANANLLRGGNHTFAKRPRSFRQAMPTKMRRLANRNALLAKLVDGEVKLVDHFQFEKPSTREFKKLLDNLSIDRTCLLAISDTRGTEARSAANIENLSVTQIQRINVFDLLNHRYLLADRDSFAQYLEQATSHATQATAEVSA